MEGKIDNHKTLRISIYLIELDESINNYLRLGGEVPAA